MAHLAFPIQAVETFDVLSTGGRVHFARQRFPRLNTRRRFRVFYGPTTLSDLDTNVMAAIRATKFATSTTLALPNVGTVTGHYVGGSVEYVYNSPTDVSLSVEFAEVPRI